MNRREHIIQLGAAIQAYRQKAQALTALLAELEMEVDRLIAEEDLSKAQPQTATSGGDTLPDRLCAVLDGEPGVALTAKDCVLRLEARGRIEKLASVRTTLARLAHAEGRRVGKVSRGRYQSMK